MIKVVYFKNQVRLGKVTGAASVSSNGYDISLNKRDRLLEISPISPNQENRAKGKFLVPLENVTSIELVVDEEGAK